MRRLHHYLLPVLLALLGYFSWSYFYGSRSVVQARAISAQVATLEIRHAQANAQRLRTEERVRLLRPQSLDPDMLDEQARGLLEVMMREEIIIYNNELN
jgi:cell division protein FtsB